MKNSKQVKSTQPRKPKLVNKVKRDKSRILRKTFRQYAFELNRFEFWIFRSSALKKNEDQAMIVSVKMTVNLTVSRMVSVNAF